MNPTFLYRQCSHEKPQQMNKLCLGSLFMAVCRGFQRKPPQNTFDKVPFLLVRFLWANKENEQAIAWS